ncbi:Helix-turn-helix [Maridesulfovibrio ferrireducens]|uniref:Helix-turn-helix n=1 Tax=Maridesulfovibrio ferrireducens TaxID=246191 RepID=A0A1G9HV68_9BACT|nr:helix-turn-helix transcriptional regulator [Maridesulfovibrio ferrireducens]SDL16868.1 Helix-turn-helix [Maridesulfovibrio ferrireducens]
MIKPKTKKPKKDTEDIADALKQFMQLAQYEVPEVNEDSDELLPFDEAFPEPTPAQLLRGARTRENMTQAKLATAVGIHRNSISEMERGVRNISVDMAKRLGKVLNTSYKRFI